MAEVSLWCPKGESRPTAQSLSHQISLVGFYYLSSRIRNSQGLTWMPARKNDWLTSVMTPMLRLANQITECAHGKLFPLLSDHWQVTLLLWISCGWFSFQRRELCYCKILEFCFLPTTPPAIPDILCFLNVAVHGQFCLPSYRLVVLTWCPGLQHLPQKTFHILPVSECSTLFRQGP